MSSPEPARTRSSPPRPMMVSSPARPLMRSPPEVPNSVSFPAVPVTVAASAAVQDTTISTAVADATSLLLRIPSLQTVRQRAVKLMGISIICTPGRSCADLRRRDPARAQLVSSVGVSPILRPLAAAIALTLVLAGAAVADVTRKKSMWGPATVDGVSQFPIYAELGVGIWQASSPGRTWPHGARRVPPTPRIRPTTGPPTSMRRSPAQPRQRHRDVAARDGHAGVGERRVEPRLGRLTARVTTRTS